MSPEFGARIRTITANGVSAEDDALLHGIVDNVVLEAAHLPITKAAIRGHNKRKVIFAARALAIYEAYRLGVRVPVLAAWFRKDRSSINNAIEHEVRERKKSGAGSSDTQPAPGVRED